MVGKTDLAEIANKFGKPDMERLGLFIEMPYMNGKGYVSPFPKPRPDKGFNMMCEGFKSKNGTQHGYFDDEFRRLFEGECLPGRGRKPPKPKKNISKMPMMPAGYPKKHCTPGDHFGTFGGIIEEFSPLCRPKPRTSKKLKPKRGFTTNPAKKGGPGYAGICLSRYPEHVKDPYKAKLKIKEYGHRIGGPMLVNQHPQPYFEKNPYNNPTWKKGPTYVPPKDKTPPFRFPGYINPTGPAKWQGGSHAGCFEKFPPFKKDKYIPKYVALRPRFFGEKNIFAPQSYAQKTLQTFSVLNKGVDLSVNVLNYRDYEPVYVKHLVD